MKSLKYEDAQVKTNKENIYVYTIRWDKYVAAKKGKLKMGKLQSSSIFVIDSGLKSSICDNIAVNFKI